MARRIYVVEFKGLRKYGPHDWEPHRCFTSRHEAQAQLVMNEGSAFARRIRIYVPKARRES